MTYPPPSTERWRQTTGKGRPYWLAGALAAGLVACILGANWLVSNVGYTNGPGSPHTLPLGGGLNAPSGVLLVGVSFTLRDVLQSRLGVSATFGIIVFGAAMSALLSPRLAAASAVTYLLSETSDPLVYTPLARRQHAVAVLASNLAGSIVDSVVFLGLAYGFSSVRSFGPGQVVGKLVAATVVAVPFMLAHRRLGSGLRPRRSEEA